MHTRWKPLRTTHVDFDSNSVETCRQPVCHAEGDVHGRHKLYGRAAEIGANGGDGFEVTVVNQTQTGWALVHECSRIADDVEEFGAALDCPEVAGGGDILGCDYHDNAEGDNGGELGRGQCQLVVEGSWSSYTSSIKQSNTRALIGSNNQSDVLFRHKQRIRRRLMGMFVY
jgi:hypothetical protein